MTSVTAATFTAEQLPWLPWGRQSGRGSRGRRRSFRLPCWRAWRKRPSQTPRKQPMSRLEQPQHHHPCDSWCNWRRGAMVYIDISFLRERVIHCCFMSYHLTYRCPTLRTTAKTPASAARSSSFRQLVQRWPTVAAACSIEK